MGGSFKINEKGEIIRESSTNSNQNLWPSIVVAMILVAVGAFVYFKSNNDTDRVKNAIVEYNNATVANDFARLASIYSENVVRFHNAYNITKSEVIAKYRNYDEMFGVVGKHIDVRWNTLQIEQLPNDELSVTYIEDYSIDRIDDSKYSKFVLEKHLILDEEYKIKSIYDVQLSKNR